MFQHRWSKSTMNLYIQKQHYSTIYMKTKQNYGTLARDRIGSTHGDHDHIGFNNRYRS